MQNVEAFKNLYVAYGGNAEDVAAMTTTAEVVNAIAGFIGVGETSVIPVKGSETVYDAKVSTLQTGLAVSDNAISGTLKFIQNGLSPAGYLAGDGNFMALKFVNDGASEIKVGLVPSQGSGMVALEEDGIAVFKVAGIYDGKQQVLKVETTENGVVKTQTFDISELTLETE